MEVRVWEGPKMFGFLVELRKNDEIIIGKVRESKLEEEKAKGFNMQVGSWVIPKQWNIL